MGDEVPDDKTTKETMDAESKRMLLWGLPRESHPDISREQMMVEVGNTIGYLSKRSGLRLVVIKVSRLRSLVSCDMD